MGHSEVLPKRILLLVVLSTALVVAWQSTPPLSLTVVAEPSVAASGETLVLTFAVTNVGDSPLQEVQVEVVIPEHTVLEGANVGSEQWAVRTPPRGQGGTVHYRAMSPLAPGQSVQLGLWVTVLQESGKSIVLDDYTATAEGLETPIAGDPFTVWVDTTPTPAPLTPSPSPTGLPTATATATHATEPTATPTVTPSPTAMPSLTPSPTFTVEIAELPPTPTPNLTSEQEQIGTFTVLIFVGLVSLIAALSIIWLIRRGRSV